MGEPVVLNQAPTFAGQLAQGLTNFIAARRKAQLEQAAVNYQHHRDDVSDQQWGQTFGLQQQHQGNENALLPGQLKAQTNADIQAGDEHREAGEKLKNEQLDNQIKQVQAANAPKMARLEMEGKVLANKFQSLQNIGQNDLNQINVYKKQVAKAEAEYAEALQRAGLDRTRAETMASEASAGASAASAALSNAETHKINVETNAADPNTVRTLLGQLDRPALAYFRKQQEGKGTVGQGLVGAQVLKTNTRPQLMALLSMPSDLVQGGFVTGSELNTDRMSKDKMENTDNLAVSKEQLQFIEQELSAIGRTTRGKKILPGDMTEIYNGIRNAGSGDNYIKALQASVDPQNAAKAQQNGIDVDQAKRILTELGQ